MPRRRPPCSHEDNPQDSAKDAAGEGPPCPPDMTPAEWVAFVRGKQCTVCHQPATRDIYWCLRARFCVDCEIKCLTNISKDWNFLTPPVVCDWVHKRDDKKARTTRKYDNKRLKGWAEDVRAMELAVPNPRSEEGRQQLNQAAAPFAQRREHAAACREWHNAQKQEHKDHLEHLREKRALQIISRLKDLGYKEKDMEFGCSIKKWTGVKRAKALTEREWQELKPEYCAVLDERRAWRLSLEKDERRTALKKEATTLYMALLRQIIVSSTSFSFLPPASVFCKMPGPVSPIIKRGRKLTEETRRELSMAVMSSVPALQQHILRKGELFNSAIPAGWLHASITHTDTPSAGRPSYSPTSVDVYPQLSSLDLAIYTFSCPQDDCSKIVLHGLDAVAHRCNGGKHEPHVDGALDVASESGKLKPRQESQGAVFCILHILGLDPSRTTPLDLDQRGLGFMTACALCNRESTQGDTTTWQLPLTWRAVVRRMSSRSTEHRCDWRGIYPVSRDEATARWNGRTRPARYLREEGLHVDVHTRCRWGCALCSVHITRAKEPPHWGSHFLELMGRTDLLTHLTEQHGKRIEDLVEGVDYFYDRGLAGSRVDSDEFC